MVDTEFYYHRQREESVMYSTNLKKRLNAYIRVTNLLFEFTDRYDFSGIDAELKNWMYVNIIDRLHYSFFLLSKIKDSSYFMHGHQLYRYQEDCPNMMPELQKICNYFYRRAEKWLKIYTDWRTSEWVASINYQWKFGKKMMLLFNFKSGFELSLKPEDVPNDWVITTDRKFLQQADVVVFHLPNLGQELDKDLDKPDEQIWIGWRMEVGKNYPFLNDPEVKELFDLWMSYGQNTDVLYPFYKYEYIDFFSQELIKRPQQNKTLLFFPIIVFEKSHHDYLEELKEHIEADLIYLEVYNNDQMKTNSKMEKIVLFQKYKFIIVLENAIETDYVTENFFDVLLAGAVPIYLGAPNIEDFAPGDNCFVDVRQFEDPHSLAEFIKACYEDEQLYAKFFEWRNQPLRQSFIDKMEEQKEHPLVKLCKKVDELNKNIK